MTITPDLLLHAYRSGIFPMAERRDDPEIFWVDPRRRGILPLHGFHISKSLAKRLKRSDYRVTLNNCFGDVIDGCAARDETWINGEIRDLYLRLHHLSHAHSLEIWKENQLVGGIYGVTVGGAFCGESMFSRVTDASKLALAWQIDLLLRTGFSLFDTQFLTPHLASLGGIEITRGDYRTRLSEALTLDADLLREPLAKSGTHVLNHLKSNHSSTVQRKTQTS